MAARPEQNPEVTQLAASVAHQLNNLVQVVNGNLELASAGLEDERLRTYLNNAALAAQQISDLAQLLYEDPGESITQGCCSASLNGTR